MRSVGWCQCRAVLELSGLAEGLRCYDRRRLVIWAACDIPCGRDGVQLRVPLIWFCLDHFTCVEFGCNVRRDCLSVGDSLLRHVVMFPNPWIRLR